MTPAARLQAVIDLLETQASQAGRPADAIMKGYFSQRRYIGAKDRTAIAETFYDVLRHRARLGWWLSDTGRAEMPRAQVLAYLALVGGDSAQTIIRLFDGRKYHPAPLDRDEHGIVQALPGKPLMPEAMPAEIRVECPPWAAASLRRALGDSFEAEMAALNASAPVGLRANLAKTTVDEARAALAQEGIETAPMAYSPVGFTVAKRPPLGNSPAFKAGLFEVQEEGAQLASLLVGARPKMQVIDFCGGTGGKTMAMAMQMNNKGRVVLADVNEGRLKRGKERLRRAGLDNVEPRTLAHERDRWIAKHKGKFDRVLLDVPCSGTGTWRRNPDSRWNHAGPGLGEVTDMQARILHSAARLTKPGGRLIYVTCSLLPEENREQIEAFLADWPDYRRLPISPIWAETLGGDAPDGAADDLLLTPNRHGTDGFYIAILERIQDADSTRVEESA